MKYKKVAILIAVLVFAGIIAGAFYEFKKTALHQNILTVEDKKISDSTKPFKINIVYPQIAGQDGFNKMVEDIIKKEISDFETNSLANDAAVKQVDPASYAKYPREYDLEIGYDKGVVDKNTVSVVLNIYNFEGGAHGASYSKAVNYNPATKKEIKLSDLFEGKPDYLKTISDFSIKDLTKQIDSQMIDGSWLNTGAGPALENFSVFLINPSTSSGQAKLTFYILQYQVAPGAAGSFKVIFPR